VINVRELRAQMVRQGITQEELSKRLGISAKTLQNWIKKGVIGSDYIEKISKELNISNPIPIFFADWVA